MIKKKEICELLGINQNTLKNWERNRKLLHKIVMEYFNKKDIEKNKEIINIFEKLTEKEKEYYINDMKARILKREIEKD